MDALTFLYWALGGGFLLFVLFMVIAISYLIKILRDFSKATGSVKDTAQKMSESVAKITEKVNETAEQITEYVVKPFTLIQYLTERARPIIEMLQRKGEEWAGYSESEEKKPKKKKGFGRKK